MLEKYYHKHLIEAGCDEAGRGCLSGPVYAAAVILPKDFENTLLNDSKQLSHEQRVNLRPIIEKEAICWAVGVVPNTMIDKINILNSSFLAMHRAIGKLKSIPQALLIDGNRFNKYKKIPHTCIIEGDCKYLSIAAASILAKTYRDDFMVELHEIYPHYGWNTNKGYATEKHRQAIAEFGATKYHRKSFRLFPDQLELEFPEI